jgi:hypothetical protein
MRYLVVLALLVLGAVFYPIASRALQKDDGETIAPDKIRSNWGKKLNPSGTIPNTGFKAIYFDRDSPGSATFHENVDSIAIKYSWSEFHNIESPKFAAYWVGKLSFKSDTTKQITVSQSWAKSRIFIDGEVVFGEGNMKESFTHEFSKGQHVIEVEYINNWHTVEFKVTVEDARPVLTPSEVADYFAENVDPSAKLFYAGLYESDSQDTSVDVTLPRTGKPIVLWLTSYEAIDWRISSRDEIAAVVVSAYSPGSRVSGKGAHRVIQLKDWPSVYSEMRRCSCTAGSFHCEDRSDIEDVASKLQAATQLKLAGYAVKYNAKAIAMQPYDDSVATRARKLRAEMVEAEKQCTRKANPDFDAMLN